MPSVQDNAEELLALLYANGPSNVVPLTNSAAIAFADPSVGSIQTVTIAQNTTFTFPAPRAGAEFQAVIKQDATGSRLATWAVGTGAVVFTGAVKTLTTTASAVDSFQAWSDGTNWYVNLFKGFA